MYGPGLQSRKIGDCSILIPNSISGKVDFFPIYCALLADISAARTWDEWVNINDQGRCTQAIFSSYCCCVGGGGGCERRHPLDPLGQRNPSPYSEYSPWSSERHINLTLRLWAFICLWEMRSACSDDCANSSNPTYSGSSHKTHKHTHHAQSICHFLQPLWSRHLQQWSLNWGGVLIEEAVAALSVAVSYK